MLNRIKLLLAGKYKDIALEIKAELIRILPLDKEMDCKYWTTNDIIQIIDEVIERECNELDKQF